MVREGSVGLLLLAGLGIFGAGVAWLKGLNPANRTYNVTVNFPTISGVQAGASVRYRGVTVGRIMSIKPGTNGVEVKIAISPADLIIPANIEATIDQSGLLGESIVNLTPKSETPLPQVAAKPLDGGCDQIVILCNGSVVKGDLGISTDALVKSSIRFADTYGKPEFYNNINSLTVNSGKAAAEIAVLAKEFKVLTKAFQQEVPMLSATAASFGSAANSVSALANQSGSTVARANTTLDQVNSLLVDNRGTLVSTLDNINVMSADLRNTVQQLGPTVDRLQRGQLLSNLETLSANAAVASKNLRDASQNFNNPANLATLQQTLDAARATFQNTQKITADLDEITGDPAVRKQFKDVIKGFSGLLSSTQQLQQQAQYAQMLEQQQATLQSAPANPTASPTLPSHTILPPQLSHRPPQEPSNTP
jgi:phospholipid/cholesterol/gamma-HCH transport system substrate-binding protein